MKSKAFLSLSVIAVASLAAHNVYAGTQFIPMNGTGSGSVTNGGGGATGAGCNVAVGSPDKDYSKSLDCLGWSWIYYKYVGPDDVTPQNGAVAFMPRLGAGAHNKTSNGYNYIEIDGGCAKKGSGFYHLGRNYYTNALEEFDIDAGMPNFTVNGTNFNYRSFSNDSSWNSSAYAYTVRRRGLGHRETLTHKYLTDLWGGSDKSNLQRTDTIAGAGRGYYDGSGAFHPTTLTAEHQTVYGSTTYTWNFELNQTLTKNGVAMYEADHYASDADVKAEYTRLATRYNSTVEKEEDKVAEQMPTDTWGFCASDSTVEQNYTGKAKISVSSTTSFDDDGNIASRDSDGNMKVDGSIVEDSDDPIEVTNKTIYFRSYGNTQATVNDAGYYTTKYTVYSKLRGAKTGDDTPYNNESDSSWHGTKDYNTLNLVPGIEYRICAINNYATYYDGAYSKYTDATACVTVYREEECSDFGKTISTTDHNNYGRMTVNAGGKNMTVGDIKEGGFTDSSTLWTTEGAQSTISYWGCMGGQAYNDGEGNGGTTTYSVSATGTSDGGITDSLYNNTNNYVSLSSLSNQSIISNELGLSWDNNKGGKTADILTRINKGYQFRPGTTSSPGDSISSPTTLKVGNVYTDTYSWPRSSGGETVETQVEVKVPYNYVLNPTNSSTLNNLTIGEEYTLDATVNAETRANKQLNMLETNNYTTSIKPGTIKKAWLFILDPDVDVEQIKNSITGDGVSEIPGSTDGSSSGSYIYQGGENDSPIDRIKSKLSVSDDDIKISEDISSSESKKETYKVGEGEKIGSKICSLVAAWPADSHNSLQVTTGNKFVTAIDDNNQSNALTSEAGDNPFWRFQVGCATVGKKPTASIEGASLTVGDTAKANYTKYEGRVFGTWAEYDLVANKVDYVYSGASRAYDSAQTTVNANVSYEDYGKTDGTSSPQTLGNMTDEKGIRNDAEIANYINMSRQFANSIYSTFYDEYGNKKTKKASDGSTVEISEHFNILNSKASNDYSITSDIINDDPNVINVIYANNIYISKDVERVDAVLIANGILDTCEKDVNRNTSTGNQELLQECNENALVVNGAVYVHGDLKLDRVYGGGEIDGDSLDPSTLAQRAEIFNYDPRIVKFAYDVIKDKNLVDTQYVKELPTRL